MKIYSLRSVNSFLRTLFLPAAFIGLVACGGDSASKIFTLTASAGIGGSISPTSVQVTEGNAASFTVTPEAIYTIANITGCGGTLTGNTYSIRAVRENCSINVSFTLKPLELSVNALPASLDENTAYDFLLTANNIRDNAVITVLEQDDTNLTNAKISDNNLLINTTEVDRDRTVNLVITLQDGDNTTRQLNKNISVKISNTSFEPTLNLIRFVNTQKERILNNTEERTLLKNLHNALYLIEANTNNLALNLALKPTTKTALENAFTRLSVDNYIMGLEADSELLAAYDVFLTQLALRNDEIRPVITKVFENFNNQIDVITDPNIFVLDPELKTASFYIGNPQFGYQSNDQWVFKPQYQYLEFLLKQHSESN